MTKESDQSDPRRAGPLKWRSVISPLSDTSSDAYEVQLSLLREAGTSRRAATALALSRTVCALSRRAILAANPGLSDEELTVRFVEAHYGAELGAAVCAELARRSTPIVESAKVTRRPRHGAWE